MRGVSQKGAYFSYSSYLMTDCTWKLPLPNVYSHTLVTKSTVHSCISVCKIFNGPGFETCHIFRKGKNMQKLGENEMFSSCIEI